MASVPQPKTYEEHLDYLYRIVRLKLWFLWHWLKDHPDEDFKKALEQRVDIYRKTDINPGGVNPPNVQYDDPAWIKLARDLETIYREHSNDPTRFEEKAFVRCEPTVTARSRRDYEERPYVLGYNCGSLHFDPPPPHRPDTVFFHIANALAPRSLFDDPMHLPRCLVCVTEKAAEQHRVARLGTGTWLNSYPRWLEYFPAEWKRNMSPPEKNVLWHYGFWGQFLTARGTFNERYGRLLRETGRFPYWPRTSWCTFKAMREHLKEKSKA